MPALWWSVLLGVAYSVWAQEPSRELSSWPRQDGVVTVIWQQPEHYQDVQAKTGQQRHYQQHVFAALGLHLQTQIQPLLGSEQRLTLTVQDLDLAGEVQPALGANMAAIRVIKDISPPRISFRYQLHNAQGELLISQQAQLVDLNFRYGSAHYLNAPLAYETRMLDRWIERQLIQQLQTELSRQSSQLNKNR